MGDSVFNTDESGYFPYPYGNYQQQTEQFNRNDMQDQSKAIQEQLAKTIQNIYMQNAVVQKALQAKAAQQTPSIQAADAAVLANNAAATAANPVTALSFSPVSRQQLIGDILKQMWTGHQVQTQVPTTQTSTQQTPQGQTNPSVSQAFLNFWLNRQALANRLGYNAMASQQVPTGTAITR